MNESSDSILNISISDYLDLYYKHHQRKKLVLFITKKQTAYIVGNQIDHWGKMVILSQQIFPKRNYNHDRYYEGAITIFSLGNDLEIYIPEKIDYIQYLCLAELLKDIGKYEKDNNIKIDETIVFGLHSSSLNHEEILKEVQSIISPINENDEEIISERVTLGNDIMEGRTNNIKNIGLNESSLEDDGRSMI